MSASTDAIATRDERRPIRDDQPHRPLREQDSTRGADRREQQAFDQHLAQ